MTKAPSRSLSREGREARLAEFRKQLSAFLGAMDPLIKRSIFEPASLSLEEHGVVWRSRLLDRSGAQFEYERLAIQLPDEWRRYTRRVGPTVARLAELRLLGHVRRPGAPRKPADTTEHELIVKLVAEATVRLGPGWALYRARQKAGGSASDDETIRPALKDLGYTQPEQSAILNSKTLGGAAVSRVADQTGKKDTSIRSSIGRAHLKNPSH
ncbi:MAG: hypothetical protein ABL971_09570 [Vicinamibacterales bacterium]